MASFCILTKKSTHLICVTSKDDVVYIVYIVNTSFTNWKPKAGPTDILVHISFSTLYPQFAVLYLNPDALDHLTNRFDDRYIPSPPGAPSFTSASTSTLTDLSSLVTAIKDAVDCFQNNKPAAHINVHSSYVTFDRTSLSSSVMVRYLVRQKPTHIHTTLTLIFLCIRKM